MLVLVCFVVSFYISCNITAFCTMSFSAMKEDFITDQHLIGKIGACIIYAPALLIKWIVTPKFVKDKIRENTSHKKYRYVYESFNTEIPNKIHVRVSGGGISYVYELDEKIFNEHLDQFIQDLDNERISFLKQNGTLI